MNKEQLAINTLRVLSSEMVDAANSGHPGLPLGAAPMAYTLWDKVMKHNPKNPNWINRDRFILSAGHGSALLYSMLHLFGYDLEMDELRNFRQYGSKTPGHPEYLHTVGVESTTGPLGQGMAMAVGMAMAERHLADNFNTEDHQIIDHYTYTLVGDGCLMEGVTNEAASLAGTLKLSKLIVLYDSNNITIDGRTDITFTENVRGRFEALGFQTFLVEDGNDIKAIEAAILEAKKSTDKPSFIEIKTKIGYGSPAEDTSGAHGAPLGEEGTKALKDVLAWQETEKFTVPQEVTDHMEAVQDKLAAYESDWQDTYEAYKEAEPELAKKLDRWLKHDFDYGFLESDDYYAFEKALASRASSGEALNRIADHVDNLFGGSADLAGSNLTTVKSSAYVNADDFTDKNIHFGVREHAMAAIANGISLHGGMKAHVATFLVFSDYMKPAIRLSAIMKQPVIYVFTHDSIGVGEDGPTHQPIDQMSMLRAVPNLVTFRPADNRETAAAWAYAIQSKDKPVALALTRQSLADVEGSGRGLLKGAYVLKDFGEKPQTILMASGSELKLAYDVAERLHADGEDVRVVSMPSMELFDAQSEEYKESVLPKGVRKRVSIEVYNERGWYKYVGLDGLVLGLNRFGESAPGPEVFDKLGFNVEDIYQKVKKL